MQVRPPSLLREPRHPRGRLELVTAGTTAETCRAAIPGRCLLLVGSVGLMADGLAQVCARLAQPLAVVHVPDARRAVQCLADGQHDVALVLLSASGGWPVAQHGLCGDPGNLAQPDHAGRAPDAPGRNLSVVSALALLLSRLQRPPLVLWADAQDPHAVLDLVRRGVRAVIPFDHPAEQVSGALDWVLSGGVYLPPGLFRSAAPSAQVDPQPPQRPMPDPTRPHDLGLTERQAQVLQLVLQGASNKHIARALNLAEGTVKTHISAVLRALNVSSRIDAVLAAQRVGWGASQVRPRPGSRAASD